MRWFWSLFFIFFFHSVSAEWTDKDRLDVDVTIDWATEKDFPAIKTIHLAAFQRSLLMYSEKKFDRGDKRKWIENQIDGELTHWKGHLETLWMKVLIGNQLVAFLAAEPGKQPQNLHLRALCVDPSFQKRGIATLLLKALAKACPHVLFLTASPHPLLENPLISLGFTRPYLGAPLTYDLNNI